MSDALKARQYLQSCKPDSVLETDQCLAYKQMIEGVWRNLIVLNANIHLLAKLIEFPFEFLGIDPQPCWTTIQRALIDGCVLAIWRIALDSRPEGSTLPQIKNFLFSSFSDPEAKESLSIEMKRLSPGEWKVTWGLKIEEIRHNYIAHHNLQKHAVPTAEEVAARNLTFAEIKNARDEITEVFDVLTLGIGYQRIPIEYDLKVTIASQVDKRTDIEVLLDLIAKESYFVNLPETNPLLWEARLSRLSSQEREQMNGYRRKFNLCEV